MSKRNKNRNNTGNNKGKGQNTKTLARDIHVGRKLKLGAVAVVSAVEPVKSTLHDAIHRGQRINNISVDITDGPFAGQSLVFTVGEGDRVEFIDDKPLTRWEKVKAWVMSWLPSKKNEEDEEGDE